ncbi:helix-turn-helix domain-containing protein [Archangium sp.]|uniref:helix-turn-helix domain-containing protein n=1 Tax=Archangium sp. TaxID=1872627 RepID=UPI00286CBC52|nr:helix-turn-helix domain-containing protein [Archangium sp.]
MRHPMLLKSLGMETRAARQRLGLTQEQVAEQLDLVTPIYGRIERGQMMPSVPTLRSLALALGLSTDTLLALMPADVAPSAEGHAPEGPLSAELRETLGMLRGWSPSKLRMLNRALQLVSRPPKPK